MNLQAASVENSSHHIDATHLPFDVWFAISLFISLQDLLSLQATCKAFFDMMNARSIWDSVVRDILSNTLLPNMQRTLASISSKDLRTKALNLGRLEYLWHRNVLTPRAVRSHHYDSQISDVLLVPGGEWLLSALYDGSIHLHTTEDLSVPAYTVHEMRSEESVDVSTTISLSLSPSPESLFLVVNNYYAGNGATHSRLLLDHLNVDMNPPEVHFLLEIRRPYPIVCAAAEGDIVAFAWRNDDGFFITVRRIFIPPNEREEVIMDLGEATGHSIGSVISILSQNLMLCSTRFALHLYEIPATKAVSEDGEPYTARVRPVWTFSYPNPASPGWPAITPILWDGPAGHHQGKVALLSGHSIYILSPPHAMDVADIEVFVAGEHIPYPERPRFAMGSRHAIWTKEYRTGPFIGLKTFSYVLAGEQGNGNLRLGERNAGLTSLLVIPVKCKTIDGLSWDEQSARVCIVTDTRRILIVDLL